MNLKEYLSQLARGEAAKFAQKLGVSRSYLSQLASGDAAISTERAVLMEQLSNGAISRRDLFPNSYWKKWPELLQ